MLVDTAHMTMVNMHEAKTHLSRLVARVQAGKQIVIARDGEPVALLSAYSKRPRRRKPGFDKGRIWVSPDFDEPLPEDLQAAFEGRE
jgi:prevent-host-death family protein